MSGSDRTSASHSAPSSPTGLDSDGNSSIGPGAKTYCIAITPTSGTQSQSSQRQRGVGGRPSGKSSSAATRNGGASGLVQFDSHAVHCAPGTAPGSASSA